MSSMELQVVRRSIKDGITADGVGGKDALKAWGASGFSTIEQAEGGVNGVKLSVNAPKFKGVVKIWGTDPYQVVVGAKQYTGVKAEQLTAVIDAMVAHPTAEVEQIEA